MDAMVASFNASQDQVELTANDQGSSYEEVFRKYQSASSAAPGQLPDVIYLQDTELQAMIDSGDLKAKQIGTQVRISKDAIDAFLAS